MLGSKWLRGALLLLVAITLAARWSGLPEAMCFIHPGVYACPTPAGVEDVYFKTADGKRLHAWFFPARGLKPGGPPAPAVLYCHGNAGGVDCHVSWGDFFPSRGISVFLFDYRSYGESEDAGRFVTRNELMTDTRAAFDAMLTRPDVDRHRVGVYGFSLGGAFAFELAAERPEVSAVCTVSTFSSWQGVAEDFAPGVADVLIQSGMDQVGNITRVGSRPVLLVQGDQDRVVNIRHAKLLLAAAQRAGVHAALRLVAGAGHVNGLVLQPGLRDDIAEFYWKAFGK